MEKQYQILLVSGVLLLVSVFAYADPLQECINHRSAGRFKQAVLAGEKAAAESQGNMAAWYCLGDSWGHMEKLPQAMSALANALRTANTDYDRMRIYYRIGDLLRLDDSQYDAAVETWTQCERLAAKLKDDKVRSVALFQLAVTHDQAGKRKEAIITYEELLKILGNDYRRAYVYNNLAALYIKQQQPAKAIELLSKAIKDDILVKDKVNEARHTINMGYALCRDKQYKSGTGMILQGLDAEKAGSYDPYWMGTGHSYLTEAYTVFGDLSKIRYHSDKTKEYFAMLEKKVPEPAKATVAIKSCAEKKEKPQVSSKKVRSSKKKGKDK